MTIPITEDTFYVEDWSDDEVDLCLSKYTTKEQAEQLKKQILENERIVYKIKDFLLDVPMMIDYKEFTNMCREILGESE